MEPCLLLTIQRQGFSNFISSCITDFPLPSESSMAALHTGMLLKS